MVMRCWLIFCQLSLIIWFQSNSACYKYSSSCPISTCFQAILIGRLTSPFSPDKTKQKSGHLRGTELGFIFEWPHLSIPPWREIAQFTMTALY